MTTKQNKIELPKELNLLFKMYKQRKKAKNEKILNDMSHHLGHIAKGVSVFPEHERGDVVASLNHLNADILALRERLTKVDVAKYIKDNYVFGYDHEHHHEEKISHHKKAPEMVGEQSMYR